jgi:hypothetical protein
MMWRATWLPRSWRSSERMTPAQFLTRMERGDVAPAYLFLGPEAYQRRRARAAVLKARRARKAPSRDMTWGRRRWRK